MEKDMGEKTKCKEKTGKLLLRTPAPWLVAAVSAAAVAVLLIPLIRLAFYAAPWYDDYNFGKYVKNFLDQEFSLKSALEGALFCVKSEWYAWQGPYTANFFSALMPAVWGEEYYFLGPLSIILLLPVGVYVLTGTLMRTVLKTTDWASCVIVQSVAAAVAVVLMHSPREGFFWYVGGMCYVGVHSFLMLLTAAWIVLLTGKNKVLTTVLMLGSLAGAVLAAGSTYLTALQGLLIGLSIGALGVLLRSRRVLLLVPSLLVYAYGFWKSVSSPGNQVRKVGFEESGIGMDPVSAIVNSFIEAFRQLGKFTDMAAVLMLILLVPIIWKMIQKINFSFRYPGLLLLWSFCLYATGFTPCLYTLGYIGPERALNVVKLTYQLLLFINEVYWLGWLYGKLQRAERMTLLGRIREKKGPVQGADPPVLFYLVMGVLIVGTCFLNPHREKAYSSYGAYVCIHSGEAYNFYQEYLERVETIKNGGDTVTVKPYNYRPEILCRGELSEDRDSGPNKAIAKWYDKSAVILGTQE